MSFIESNKSDAYNKEYIMYPNIQEKLSYFIVQNVLL